MCTPPPPPSRGSRFSSQCCSLRAFILIFFPPFLSSRGIISSPPTEMDDETRQELWGPRKENVNVISIVRHYVSEDDREGGNPSLLFVRFSPVGFFAPYLLGFYWASFRIHGWRSGVDGHDWFRWRNVWFEKKEVKRRLKILICLEWRLIGSRFKRGAGLIWVSFEVLYWCWREKIFCLW